MIAVLLVLLFGTCSCTILSDAPSEQISQWSSFVEEHEKLYDSPEEESRRFDVFRENMRKIEELNERHKGKATFGVTKFSDLTENEFAQMFNEESDPKAAGASLCTHSDKKPFASRDWRPKMRSPVRNQGLCGSCYIFSVLGAIEAHYAIRNNRSHDFSEQEVLDCLASGCVGGSRLQVYSRAEAPGLESESDYAHEYCEERRTCDKTAAPRMSIKGHCNLFGEEQIRRAVDQVGPVSLGINATMPEYQHYRGGIISSRSCGHKRTNHAVLAVGYGEKNGVKFWLIRNSYGPQWGEDGHFKIERGANMCGVETFANYPVLN